MIVVSLSVVLKSVYYSLHQVTFPLEPLLLHFFPNLGVF